jgi:DNA polymerase III delta prime subunit
MCRKLSIQYLVDVLNLGIYKMFYFRFAPLTLSTQLERLELICKKENLDISSDILKYLINISEGDLRRTINLLQTISTFDKRFINENVINDICGVIPLKYVDELYNVAKYQKPEIIVKQSDEFLSFGYDVKQFNLQFTEFISACKDISDEEKSKINQLILDCEINLLEGSSQNIQLYNLLCGIRNLFSMNVN